MARVFETSRVFDLGFHAVPVAGNGWRSCACRSVAPSVDLKEPTHMGRTGLPHPRDTAAAKVVPIKRGRQLGS